MGLGATGSIVAGYALATLGYAVGAGIGGALGNLAGQETARGLGLIDHVDKSSLRNTFKVDGVMGGLTALFGSAKQIKDMGMWENMGRSAR